MRTMAIVAAAIVMSFTTAPTAAECEFKFCKNKNALTTQTYDVTNTHRQRIGDIYDPGHGRRLQIRNNSRQIIGYIEHDGTVTNMRRQKFSVR